MSDPIDIASDYEQHMLQNAIDNRPQFTGVSERYCEECGAEIPEQRRQLGGVKLCVDCQSVVERKQARFR